MLKNFIQINIHNFRISEVDTGSVIAMGHNYFRDWHTINKTNAGLSRLIGDSCNLSDNDFCVDDPDFQDMINLQTCANEKPAKKGAV